MFDDDETARAEAWADRCWRDSGRGTRGSSPRANERSTWARDPRAVPAETRTAGGFGVAERRVRGEEAERAPGGETPGLPLERGRRALPNSLVRPGEGATGKTCRLRCRSSRLEAAGLGSGGAGAAEKPAVPPAGWGTTSGTTSGAFQAGTTRFGLAPVELPKRSYDRAFAVLAVAAKAVIVLLIAWAIRRI
jgi:hypothetical protein